MTEQHDIERALRVALDPIEGPAAPPTHLMKMARKRRWMTHSGALLSVVIIGAGVALGVAGPGFRDSKDIKPASPAVIPFERLPVRAASKTHGLIGSPLAPQGFPDCTLDMLEIKGENGNDFVSLTIGPLKGVQCGLGWWPDGLWTDSSGEVYEPPRANGSFYSPSGDDGRDLTRRGRLLLMGSGDASSAGVVANRVCSLEPPITYSITVGDEPLEIGTLENPTCRNPGVGDAQELPYSYDLPALETPMGSLDPRIEEAQHQNDELSFVLALENDTDETIVVGRCPFYDVSFATSEGNARLRSFLNCPAAPNDVLPGDTLRFRIVMPLQGSTGEGTLKVTLRDERRILNEVETEVSAP